MKFLASMLCAVLCVTIVTALPENFQQTTYVQGLAQTTSMQFSPDGRLFVTEQGCRVRVIENGTLLAQPFLSISWPNCQASWEMGMLGLAFDPNFTQNGYVYVYYTYGEPAQGHRVSRFTADPANPNRALAGSEVYIMNNIPVGTGCHNGGAIHFGTDEKLYIAVGDGCAVPQNSQQANTRLGKMLRINPDGSIPADNPFVSNASYLPEIYALGLRNPFSFAVDSVDGRIYANDVGGALWEEINHILPGRNYGWPTCEGACSNPAFENPVFAYQHHEGTPRGFAITGGTFYRANSFPSEYQGAYFFGDYTQTWIYVRLANGVVEQFTNDAPSPIALAIGSDGALYYANYQETGGFVRRIQYFGEQQNTPPVAVADAQPSSGAVPLTVSLSAAGSSDPNGDPLTYVWNPGDGSGNLSGMTVEHTYTQPGLYTAVVSVCDPSACSTAETSITVGSLPTPSISLPTGLVNYSAGDTITYSGSAVSSTGEVIPPENLSWIVRFHHDDHTHPAAGPVIGSGGVLQLGTEGHTDHTVWFRFVLTATDALGLSNSTYVDVFPNKASITIVTDPPGLSFELEGQPRQTPYETMSVVGVTRTVAAPSPQTLNGVTYQFSSWSHSAEQENSFSSPAQDTTYTAFFIPVEQRIGDLNGDGVIDILDIIRIVENFRRRGNYDPGADINGDGVVNILDMVLLAREWAADTPPPGDTTPPGITTLATIDWTSGTGTSPFAWTDGDTSRNVLCDPSTVNPVVIAGASEGWSGPGNVLRMQNTVAGCGGLLLQDLMPPPVEGDIWVLRWSYKQSAEQIYNQAHTIVGFSPSLENEGKVILNSVRPLTAGTWNHKLGLAPADFGWNALNNPDGNRGSLSPSGVWSNYLVFEPDTWYRFEIIFEWHGLDQSGNRQYRAYPRAYNPSGVLIATEEHYVADYIEQVQVGRSMAQHYAEGGFLRYPSEGLTSTELAKNIRDFWIGLSRSYATDDGHLYWAGVDVGVANTTTYYGPYS